MLPTLSRTPSSENSTDQEGDSPGGSIDDLRRDLGPSPSPRQMRAHSLQYSRYDPISESSFRLPGAYILINNNCTIANILTLPICSQHGK